jgi:hypothetical protein
MTVHHPRSKRGKAKDELEELLDETLPDGLIAVVVLATGQKLKTETNIYGKAGNLTGHGKIRVEKVERRFMYQSSGGQWRACADVPHPLPDTYQAMALRPSWPHDACRRVLLEHEKFRDAAQRYYYG